MSFANCWARRIFALIGLFPPPPGLPSSRHVRCNYIFGTACNATSADVDQFVRTAIFESPGGSPKPQPGPKRAGSWQSCPEYGHRLDTARRLWGQEPECASSAHIYKDG